MNKDGLAAIEKTIEQRSDDRRYYVYIWFYKTENGDLPFYVGKGSGVRYRTLSGRSKIFLDFVRTHECWPVIAVSNRTDEEAYWVEREMKTRMKDVFWIMDAEDNKTERKQRQREGIDSAKKKGVGFGRPKKENPDFQKIAQKQKEGLLTVKEACEVLGMSRATYYRKIKEVC